MQYLAHAEIMNIYNINNVTETEESISTSNLRGMNDTLQYKSNRGQTTTNDNNKIATSLEVARIHYRRIILDRLYFHKKYEFVSHHEPDLYTSRILLYKCKDIMRNKKEVNLVFIKHR